MNSKIYLEQLSKELHKPFSKKFQRRHVRAEAKDSCWSMDLVIMIEWAGVNDGNKYMLNVVDVFTRFAFSRPMKTKTAVDTYAAFIDIVETSKRKPKSIWVDEGKEFYNSTFKTWMKHNNATMYSTYGEQKSVICERFNRTLKSEMWRHPSSSSYTNTLFCRIIIIMSMSASDSIHAIESQLANIETQLSKLDQKVEALEAKEQEKLTDQDKVNLTAWRQDKHDLHQKEHDLHQKEHDIRLSRQGQLYYLSP